jgi:hypothetical protein
MSSIDPLNTGLVPGAASAVSAAGRAAAPQEDFSGVFGEAMTRALGESALGAYGGAAALPPGDPSGYLPSLLLNGAAQGQTGANEMLMYMLMSMMQEFKNSDLAPLMTALAALLPAGGPAASGLSGVSGFSGSGASGPAAYAAYPGSYQAASLPEQAWLPASVSGASVAGKRSAGALNRVISQFNVENAARYSPRRNGKTYCNIFVWDVTRALGCEIPHYVDEQSGGPRYYPDVKGAYELDANATCDWLKRQGADNGWREITAAAAQLYANAGYPVVSAWRNTGGGAGHVQIVCPSRNGAYDPQRGVTVAQAGSRNFSYAHISEAMSADKIKQARYYAHE